MSNLRLQTALTVLPVLSAGLYLMGATYHQGYLEAFGFEDSLFQLATDRLLLSGFIAFISFSLIPLVYTAAAVVVLVFTVIVAAILSSAPKVRYWQSIVLAKFGSLRSKHTPPSLTMSNLVEKSATLYAYTGGTVIVVMSLVLIALLSAKSGKAQAHKEIASFAKQEGNHVMLYSPSLAAPLKAKQIVCGTTHCAFWLGSGALALKHEQIERIETHNPSFQQTVSDGR